MKKFKIKNYPGYFLDGKGNLYSKDKLIMHRNGKLYIRPGRKIKPIQHQTGYMVVGLTNLYGAKTHRLHRLIAQVLIPNPHNLPEINHINGIKNDNRLKNLEWSSRKDNAAHAAKNKLYKSGKDNHATKLTIKMIDSARKRILAGELIMNVAESLDVAYVSLNRAFKKFHGKLPLTLEQATSRGGKNHL